MALDIVPRRPVPPLAVSASGVATPHRATARARSEETILDFAGAVAVTSRFHRRPEVLPVPKAHIRPNNKQSNIFCLWPSLCQVRPGLPACLGRAFFDCLGAFGTYIGAQDSTTPPQSSSQLFQLSAHARRGRLPALALALGEGGGSRECECPVKGRRRKTN
jgi:hypothetical protein